MQIVGFEDVGVVAQHGATWREMELRSSAIRSATSRAHGTLAEAKLAHSRLYYPPDVSRNRIDVRVRSRTSNGRDEMLQARQPVSERSDASGELQLGTDPLDFHVEAGIVTRLGRLRNLRWNSQASQKVLDVVR